MLKPLSTPDVDIVMRVGGQSRFGPVLFESHEFGEPVVNNANLT